jgi:hypothetical protein
MCVAQIISPIRPKSRREFDKIHFRLEKNAFACIMSIAEVMREQQQQQPYSLKMHLYPSMLHTRVLLLCLLKNGNGK